MFFAASMVAFFFFVGVEMDKIRRRKKLQRLDKIRLEELKMKIEREYNPIIEELYRNEQEFRSSDKYKEKKRHFFLALAELELRRE